MVEIELKFCVLISSQSISEFLKDLPTFNEENFSLYNVDNARTKRPSWV